YAAGGKPFASSAVMSGFMGTLLRLPRFTALRKAKRTSGCRVAAVTIQNRCGVPGGPGSLQVAEEHVRVRHAVAGGCIFDAAGVVGDAPEVEVRLTVYDLQQRVLRDRRLLHRVPETEERHADAARVRDDGAPEAPYELVMHVSAQVEVGLEPREVTLEFVLGRARHDGVVEALG